MYPTHSNRVYKCLFQDWPYFQRGKIQIAGNELHKSILFGLSQNNCLIAKWEKKNQSDICILLMA